MELRHSCLIVATHDTSLAFCRATKVTLQHREKCACHEKWHSKKWEKLSKNGRNVFTVIGRSDHDPSMNPSARNPPDDWGYFSRWSRAFCIEKCNISRSRYHSKFHEVQRLPRNVTAQHHQILPRPRKLTVQLECNFIKHCARHEKWQLNCTKYTAPATKTECATWMQLHQILPLPRKVYYSLTLLLFFWLYYSFTLLFFDPTFLWHYYSFTLLCFYSTILLLYYFLTLRSRPYIGSFSTKLPLILHIYTFWYIVMSIMIYTYINRLLNPLRAF